MRGPILAVLLGVWTLGPLEVQAGEGGSSSGGRIEFGKPAVGKAAPTLADIDALDRAVTDAWEQMALTQRRALFVSTPANLYGGYAARPSNVFAQGEKLLTYVEPVGYTWRPSEGGTYRFGLTLDFAVKTPGGKILGGQQAFQSFDFTSRFKNREVFVSVTMSLEGIEPGNYVLVYTLRDQGSAKTSSFEQPFTIAPKG
jgi:hypothetical protein